MNLSGTFQELHFIREHGVSEMQRVLYIYACLNREVQYVQGMNELFAPLYFIFLSSDNYVQGGQDTKGGPVAGQGGLDGHPQQGGRTTEDRRGEGERGGAESERKEGDTGEWREPAPLETHAFIENAEADAFFCFAGLMADRSTLFVQKLDEDERGLRGWTTAVEDVIAHHDPEVRLEMATMNVEGHFYCLRWLTALFAREFDLPDVVRLWDTLLASRAIVRYVEDWEDGEDGEGGVDGDGG